MKKVILIVLPLLIIGGSVVGLGMAGVVNIPGLTPKKQAAAPVVEAKKPEPKKEVAKKPKEAPKAKSGDPAKGQEAVAKLWNEMEMKSLLPITEKWKDAELAPILAKMDNEKVVELLSGMKPKRAVALTRAIQKIAETGS
jgi:flagellar motility protein MotE (MotC chaperone)